MVAFPPSKINLGLNVLSKRSDGFHDLETCFYPVPWTDIIEIIPSNEFSITFSGNVIPGKIEENLCVKAYDLLKSDFDISPVKIHLHKIIPIGAGLGGGSSDAAYTLRLINQVLNLQLSNEQLKGYASQLGSDCSFFIQDHAMLGVGKGEIIEQIEVNLTDYWLVVVKSAIHISTQQAYASIIPRIPTVKIREIVHQPIETWRGLLKNDFEESVFRKHDEIREIKEKLELRGALYASMSGSGSAVYALFEKPIHLKNFFDGMTYWEGVLL